MVTGWQLLGNAGETSEKSKFIKIGKYTKFTTTVEENIKKNWMKKKIKELLKENCFPYIHCFVYEEKQKDTRRRHHNPHKKKHRYKFSSIDEKQKERNKKRVYLSDWQHWKKLL